ncbi:MAG TPA: PAS domain S-box protein [Gemmatimonadaceae bacterium]|nr:PAS domain S-box protein [Gemmatimonadaceae bacterium]
MQKVVTCADYQTIVECAPEAVIVYANGRFLYLNAFAAERLGAPARELIGHPIMEFVHRDSVNLVVARLKQLEETGKGGLLAEVKFVSRDGTVMPAEVVSIPINFQGEKAILGLIRDISQRTEAELALRESEERFGNAFRYSPHGMAFVALDGRWLRANKSLCDMLGYTEEELRGISFQKVTHPEDVPGDLDQLRKLVQGEISSYNRVKRYFRKDGRMIWVSIAVSAVHDASGAPSYFIGQIQDVTVQRQMEAEAAQAERLAGIAETTIAVAHEMNNVLTVLVMNAELLSENPAKEEIPEIAAEILAASQRIAGTVQRLRNLGDPGSVDYLGEKKMIDLSSRTPKQVSKRR